MAKRTVDLDKSAETWAEIDSTTANVIGKRVFYSDPKLGKRYAHVVGVTGRRNEKGQLLDVLVIFPNALGGSIDLKEVALSDDRMPGTYALANDGDLTDNPNTPPHTEQPPVEAEVPAEAPTTTAPLNDVTEAQFDPADANRDGTVSEKEQRRYDKGRRQ